MLEFIDIFLVVEDTIFVTVSWTFKESICITYIQSLEFGIYQLHMLLIYDI